jgi:hypothetical protein
LETSGSQRGDGLAPFRFAVPAHATNQIIF